MICGALPSAPNHITANFFRLCRVSAVVAVVDDGSDGVTSAGDQVTLTFTITNDGNTCLGNIVVDEPFAGALDCTKEFSGTSKILMTLLGRHVARMATIYRESSLWSASIVDRALHRQP